MRKIEYTYITVARQLMFIACFIFIFLHFAVITQVLIFKIDKYYDAMNFPLTYAIYAIIFIILIGLFFQHRFFYSTYNKETLEYTNKLLRHKRTLDLHNVGLVICGSKGVYFYNKDNTSRAQSDANFYLPFFRGGRMDSVGLDKLLKYLQTLDVEVIKNYKIMPGYGKKTKLLSFLYGLIGICFIGNSSQALYTVIVLFGNH